MSELSIILIIAISFGAGVIVGWVQRDQDKKRDAKTNAQTWLIGLELYDLHERVTYNPEQLRQIYRSSLEKPKLERVK